MLNLGHRAYTYEDQLHLLPLDVWGHDALLGTALYVWRARCCARRDSHDQLPCPTRRRLRGHQGEGSKPDGLDYTALSGPGVLARWLCH